MCPTHSSVPTRPGKLKRKKQYNRQQYKARCLCARSTHDTYDTLKSLETWMNAGPPREEHLLDEVVGITFIVLLFSAIIVHHYLFPLKPSKFVRLSPIHFGSTLIFASCAIHLPLVLTDVFSFGYVRLLWILPACRVITNNKNIIKIGMVATTRYCIRPSCQGSGLLLFVSVYSDILVTSSSSKSSPIIMTAPIRNIS